MSRKWTKEEKEELHEKLREDLELVLGAIWIATADMSFHEVADAAGLSVQTVTRLYYGAWVTPHARTLQKLGRVVGYQLTFTETGVTVKVDKRKLAQL